ncbi:MAG: flagellar hook-length control protein FliK [Lachnospiraceae bacterium]|nr:flagellar hook-length control protein FliK [Lachnospiraceae bacterium]
MNISDSTINFNISTNNSGIKVSTPSISDGGAVTANSQITMAKEGQIFNGKILDITNNKVSIMLDNNKTLYAQMTEAINMNIGDALTFMIKENNGSNVLIKPYGSGVQNMKDNAIFKILDSNSISITEKNYQITEGLMKNNMPVDKGSMQRIMQQSYKFPDASIDTIINLNKIGMPVNEANIAQYEAYMTNNHQLTQDISNLSISIVDMNKETVSNILNQMGTTSEEGIKQLFSFNSNLLGALSDTYDNANIVIDDILKNVQNFNENDSDIWANVDNKPNLIIDNSVNTDIPTEFTDKLTDFSNKINIKLEKIEVLIKELKSAGISDNIVNSIIDKSETPMQLLNNINEVISHSKTLNINSENIKDLLLSDSYNQVLSETIKDKLSLNPKDMDNPKEIDDLYKSIYDKTNKLLDAFSSGGNSQAGDNMSQAAKSMQQRIDFMQNLNNMFAYAQLPIKLDSNQMNSDLFVYMNKRNLRGNKEDVSALLHLDMDHLGATDVHVSLHGTNVHTKFYVEDELSAKIIDEHMTMLEKAISENGFNLTNEVITREPTLATGPNMAIKEMLGDDLEKSVKRYSFDVRM